MPPLVVAVRTATAADLERIGAIYRAASLSNDGDRRYLLAHPEVLDLDRAGVDAGRTRVAVLVDDPSDVVGFATVRPRPPIGELDDLFVDPPSMRRGVAAALVAAVVAEARAEGLVRLEVTGNVHARGFYESVGFVVVGQVPTRFDPGLRMHLDLTGPGPSNRTVGLDR